MRVRSYASPCGVMIFAARIDVNDSPLSSTAGTVKIHDMLGAQ